MCINPLVMGNSHGNWRTQSPMWRGWAPFWRRFLAGDWLPFIRFLTWNHKGTWVPKSSHDFTRTYAFFNWCGTEIETWSAWESSHKKRKQSTSIKFQRSDATNHRGDDVPRQRETKIQTKKNALQVTNDEKASKVYTMDLQAVRGQKNEKNKNWPQWSHLRSANQHNFLWDTRIETPQAWELGRKEFCNGLALKGTN